jgi:hypothetical protein
VTTHFTPRFGLDSLTDFAAHRPVLVGQAPGPNGILDVRCPAAAERTSKGSPA